MPLDRAHLNRTARWLVPLCPAFIAYFGACLLFTPAADMLRTPSFRTANDWMPLTTWGVLCLGVAAFQVAAMMTRRRSWYVSALGVGLVGMAVWTLVFVVSALQHQAPWSAPGWPAFVSVVCWVTLMSVESREG